MDFKVGDKVRIKKDLDSKKDYKVRIVSEMEKYKGTVAKIVGRRASNSYVLDIDESCWRWSDDTFELVEEKEFTKSDLQDGDIVTLRNGLKYRKSGRKICTRYTSISLNYFTENLKYREQNKGNIDIIKIERPTKYETVYERLYERVEEDKKEILDETEKEYLKAVIKPFKKKS